MRLVAFITCYIFILSSAFSQFTSTQDGDWQTGATWGGSGPGVTGLGAVNITVNHKVIVGSYGNNVGLTFAANNEDRNFVIGDTLIIYGNVTFGNKAMDFNIGNATVIIVGNLSVANKLNLDSDGTLVVTGTFSKSGSNGDFTGSGTVYAGGYSGDASNFIPGSPGGGTEQSLTDLETDATTAGPGSLLEDIFNFVDGNGATALPITLKEFKAVPNNSSIGLNWTTLTEENFEYFEIQRAAADGEFSIVATINGNGFSKEEINYSWNDENPRIGMNYYRLESVDYDGYRETFPSVAIIFEPENQLVSIAPNPVSLNTSILLSNTFGEEFSLKILGLDGSTKMDVTRIDNAIQLPSSLKAGIYLAVFEVNGLKKTQKLIIR